jgi:hypothetical protein
MIIILGTQEIIILFIYISFCEFADNWNNQINK